MVEISLGSCHIVSLFVGRIDLFCLRVFFFVKTFANKCFSSLSCFQEITVRGGEMAGFSRSGMEHLPHWTLMSTPADKGVPGTLDWH